MKLFNRLIPVIAIALLLLTGAGCGDDPDPVSKLVGTWLITSVEADVRTPGGVELVAYLISIGAPPEYAEELADELINGEPFDVSGTVEFKKDGKYRAVDGADISDGTWELSTDEKVLTLDKGTNYEGVIDITTLNDTELVFDVDVTDDYDFPENTIEYHALIKFKRL